MYSKVIIASYLLSTASAFHFFNIYPAQKCKDKDGFDTCDPENQTEFSKDAIKPCGDGTFCSTGICGTWLGQKAMCCSGSANLEAGGSITNQLTQSCSGFKSQLENFDIKGSDAKAPLKGDACKDPLKTFGVAVGAKEGADFVTGNKTTYNECCAMTGDAITLYKDFLAKVDSAACIPALDAKEGGGDSSSSGSSDSDKKGSGIRMGASVVGVLMSSVFIGMMMA